MTPLTAGYYRLLAPAVSGAIRADVGSLVEVEKTNGDGSVATVAWVTVNGFSVHFSAIPAESLAKPHTSEVA